MTPEIILLLLCTALLTTTGAVLLKFASKKFSFRKPLSWTLFFAITAYLGSTIPFVFALRKTELSFAYPFTALQYLLVCLFGIFFLQEKISKKKIIGIICILTGIVLVGIGR